MLFSHGIPPNRKSMPDGPRKAILASFPHDKNGNGYTIHDYSIVYTFVQICSDGSDPCGLSFVGTDSFLGGTWLF